jgi:Cu(I)/Ag(I) efflux system membrane fusion protein
MKTRILTVLAGLMVILHGVIPLQVAAAEDEREIRYWVAPMDPNYRRDKPGKSPMGMDLIPVYADGDEDGSTVTIKPEVVQNLGVRTAVVERTGLWRRIDTVGYVAFDESKLSHIHLRTKGWVEKLYVESEGDRVRQGDPILQIYSPELVNAQEEYVQAVGFGNKTMLRASHDRLVALGIPLDQIKQLAKTRKVQQRVTIYAPQDGVVATLPIRDGMYVKPETRIMSLADLSSVWVQAEVFERQADWVRTGNPADIRLSYQPGREWEGTVQYIYPSLDPKTRTLRVRMRFDNPDEALKPNMYANVRIYGGLKENVIVIPIEALIRTGREERVLIARGEGRFEARQVKAGIESGGWIEIVSGLKPGEEVVTSGQFLIDSEASMKASMTRMSTPPDNKTDEVQPSPAAGPVTGRGVIKALLPDVHKVNLQHEPIPQLGWPGMTMDFQLGDGVSLNGLAEGDSVRFQLEERDGSYVITVLDKTANGGASQ